MDRALLALINTVIIMMIIPILGIVLNWIIDKTVSFLYRHFGRFITLLIVNYLTFVGTMHHELSHAILAFITGAKVIKIDLFYPNGNTLGQVLYRTRGNIITKSIQNTMASIAPMLIGTITEYWLISAFRVCDILGIKLLLAYLIISILFHMRLSSQDLKMCIRGLPICSLIIGCILYITKFNILNIIM